VYETKHVIYFVKDMQYVRFYNLPHLVANE